MHRTSPWHEARPLPRAACFFSVFPAINGRLGDQDLAGKPGPASSSQTEIPFNEHIRLRTRTGHQILLHNSEDIIYIANAQGSAWLEMTSNGKIDIYGSDSINIRTETDLNITADRDINILAGRDFNLTALRDKKVKVAQNNDVRILNNDRKY